MMRAATIAMLMSTLAVSAVWGQAPPEIRQVVRTSFPFAITPSVGLGFGAIRQRNLDPTDCPDRPCVGYGTGSGWQARVEMQAPLGRTLGFEVGGQIGRQSIRQCARGACSAIDHVWAYRGSAMLLWRFKPRAPVFFGVGATLAHFSSNPVYQDPQPTTEPGAAGVIGLDLALAERVGVRVAWRNFFLVPKQVGPVDASEVSSVAWEQSLMFGARIKMGK